jgi:ribosomal protein S18 acetylase RimI-like enzyme
MKSKAIESGKLRKYFGTLEKNDLNLKKLENVEKSLDNGMEYIQMVLPIDKITKETERKLRENVEHNILRAKIRKAREFDLEALMNLYNKAWLTSHEPFRALNLNNMKSLYNDPRLSIFIANVYGLDVGFLILEFEGKNKQYGIIVAMGVNPRFQRKGLGKIMALFAWDLFKKNKISELRSEVYKNNKVSINFLRSMGFEERGIKVYKSEDYELTVSGM